MRILENTHIDFLGNRNKAYVFSAIIIILGMVMLVWRGLEVGIDFLGGSEFVVQTDGTQSVVDVRGALAQTFGAEPEVKRFGDDLLVRLADVTDPQAAQEQVVSTIATAFPESNPRITRSDNIAPRFANDLRQGAIYAVLGSLLVIFVYILIRFEWRFGVGAVAALFHDVLFTIGMFAMLHHILPFSLQIDQTIIAAFLTIVGYSINDTVVVFDRIREDLQVRKGESFELIANDAINRTLSRTLITSGTTLLVVLVLFILGGEVLKGFSFALLMGIGIGTYSSIFVATPMVVELRKRMKPAPALATKR